MKRTIAILVFLFLILNPVYSQDSIYARNIIKNLCAKKFYGRGYSRNGAVKAGKYIAEEMQKNQLHYLPGKTSFFQPFTFPVNIIESVSFKYNSKQDRHFKTLQPGYDFIINADAESGSLEFSNIECINKNTISDSTFRMAIMSGGNSNGGANIIIIDTIPMATRKKYGYFLHFVHEHFHTISFTNDKLTWTVSTESSSHYHLEIRRNAISGNIAECKLKVKSKLRFTHQNNIIGCIKGNGKPDSFIYVTAHYDHLGRMGKKAVFPGANDNACGVAMLLDLAKYYTTHPPRYSMVFIAFAAEEAGLIGSRHFVEREKNALSSIRFLFNIDLVGTGEKGGTVVNGSLFHSEFRILDSLNREGRYLPKILARGKAANSDHYFFTEAGVHSFFLYLAGPRPAYHDVFDVEPTLTMAGYNNTFQLLTRFFKAL